MSKKKTLVIPEAVKLSLSVQTLLIAGFMLAAGAVIYFLMAHFDASPATVIAVLAGYFAFAAAFYFALLRPLQMRNIRNVIIESRMRALTSVYTINTQMDIIINLFLTLEKIRRTENNPSLNLKYEKLSGFVYKMKESVVDISEYSEMIESPELLDENKLEAKLKEINGNLYTLSESIIGTVEEFTNAYSGKKMEASQSNYGMATLVYFLANIIPIISDLSSTSNKFSRDIIMKVIGQFEEIANFSNLITEDIRNTMKDLMDEDRQDSLAFIIKKAHEIVEDFETFFKNMEGLKNASNTFIDTSIEKLKGIADIADSIEEIAETIKVISLNVSIEAANTGSAGKGFQVLARDLREFAQKTRLFAQDVKVRVSDTILTTERMKNEYIENMNSVYRYVEDMKISIVSFEQIIVISFDKIKNIIDTLQSFSTRISEGIKDIIGKLQYYDITSQEVEHLSQFIEQIFKTSSSRLHEFRIEEILDDKTRLEIKNDILNTIERIITTKNEREIFEEYQKIFGIVRAEIDLTSAPSIAEFKSDDDIVIF